MTREEFDKACSSVSVYYRREHVTDAMFDDINFVYTWYPTISDIEGKEQIAILYTSFGFAIIQDMYKRASEACRLQKEISEVKERLRSLQVNSSQLRNGNGAVMAGSDWSYVTDLAVVD